MSTTRDLPRRDTILAIDYDDNTLAVTLPPGWVALDTESDSLLDDIADAVTAELERWIRLAQVGVPDDDDVMLGVTATQSESLAMIRRLTDDVPATTVILGIDVTGEEAEVLISAMTFAVLGDVEVPAADGARTVETGRGVTGIGFAPDDGLPDFRRGAWVLRLPGTPSTVFVNAESVGAGAEVMPDVWDWVIDQLDPTGLEAQLDEMPITAEDANDE